MKTKLICLLSIFSTCVFAQSDSLKRDSVDLNEVIVTATRTERNADRIPVPFKKISSTEIKNRGLVRLNEVLREQTGLAIVTDHGQGIQIQGFSPEYTLILVDGEPLIGRTSGTLELSRVSVNDIEKIEIVKGSSSCLYGSEAMAGVINIITSRPPGGLSSSVSARYGTNNSADLSVNTSYAGQKASISGFLNRFSSDGYSLRPQTGLNTVSPYSAYTASIKSSYQAGTHTKLNLSGRLYTNSQDDRFLAGSRFVSGPGRETNLNIAPSVTHQFSNQLSSTLRLYHSTYRTRSELDYEDNASLYEETFFNQSFNRAEVQNDYSVKTNLKLTAGLGSQYETVEATRYDDKQSFFSGYLYVQADWTPFAKLNLVAGGRYDMHNVYRSQLSPKLAASYSVSDKFLVYASAGKGYKAPDFRQLYLNFTNNVVGYSVFGYEDAAANLAKLQAAGQIQNVLININTLRKLNAENSMSYNVGFRAKPFARAQLTVNAFRNNISDLIESVPIAIKTNGQSVFSYSNVNSVFTRGAETELNYSLTKALSLGAGFQFLEAYNRDMLDKIDREEVFTRDPNTNQTRLVRRSEYGGLLNRSRYMANMSVSYGSTGGFNATLRSFYRGRYGYGDTDGNGILNMDSEYVKGYVTLNASASQSVWKKKLNIQLSAENLFNYRDPDLISNLPGRLVYLGMSYNIAN